MQEISTSPDEILGAIVPIDKIRLNPNQPRKVFAELELQELAQSILSVGIIHPPLVRPLEEVGFYELVSGERRFQASKLAGLAELPVHIKKSSLQASAEMALIENIQRVDLNPIEIAKALQQLIDTYFFNQEALARRIGKKRSTVANYLRLLVLPKNIQAALLQNLITMGHAKAILSLDGIDKQQLIFEIILRDQLSVREAEKTAQRLAEKAKKKKLKYVTPDFFLAELAEKMQSALGTKVHIQGKGKRGRVVIDYYNLDDLDRLIRLFGCESVL